MMLTDQQYYVYQQSNELRHPKGDYKYQAFAFQIGNISLIKTKNKACRKRAATINFFF